MSNGNLPPNPFEVTKVSINPSQNQTRRIRTIFASNSAFITQNKVTRFNNFNNNARDRPFNSSRNRERVRIQNNLINQNCHDFDDLNILDEDEFFDDDFIISCGDSGSTGVSGPCPEEQEPDPCPEEQ
jgi:hypothetical protein